MDSTIHRGRPKEEGISREHSKTTFFQKCKNYFREYCDNTDIHGAHYFAQRRPSYEKLWWLLVFIFALSGCGFMIYQIYDKWAKSPVIVSFATKSTLIYTVPFPAVTVCSNAKISHRCFNWTSTARKKLTSDEPLTNTEQKYFDYVTPLCRTSEEFSSPDYEEENDTMFLNKEGAEFLTEDFYEFLEECSALKIDQLSVFWMGDRVNASKVFQPLITEEGICFTFNMLGRNDIYSDDVWHYKNFHNPQEKVEWHQQNGYLDTAGLKTYPRRALKSGPINSLNILFSLDRRDMDYGCNGLEQGIRVILHLPGRIPRPKYEYLLVPFNQGAIITIFPEIMTTSDTIKSYSTTQRKCYYPNEKYLKFFDIYSRDNCLYECLTNYTLHKCGCVAFFMPRTNTTPVCGVAKQQCMSNAESQYFTSNLYYRFVTDKEKAQRHHKETVCDCLPLCKDLTYDATIMTLEPFWDDYIESVGLNDKQNRIFSTVNIYFKKDVIVTRERNELYGPIDFISNFGGLLGLFTGFSIVSLMEIIYFLTLRLVGNNSIFGRWYGEDNN